MKVLGIVVEYNPFHNGHLYHLDSARKLVNPDYTMAVMSGNFTQRGEPAVINKFSRAEIALKAGVDLVVELPFLYAVQDAGGFAFGAVGILHRSGVVTDIVFGSESADEEFLREVAYVLHEQPWRYQELLHVKLKKGLSFPNARKEALVEYFKENGGLNPERVRFIENSNDILGVEYVRALLRYDSSIKFHPIKRIGARYREIEFKGEYSSATAIRELIKKKEFDSVKKAVPEFSYEIVMKEINKGRGPIFWEDMDKVFMYKLRLMDREDFENIYGFVEGLDKRFSVFSKSSCDIKELVENVKSKRFTFTRIRRLMIYALFNIKKDLMEVVNEKGPQYIRVLGFTEKGRKLLSYMKKRSLLPIISTPSLYKKILLSQEEAPEFFDEDLAVRMFGYDIKATNVYSLFYPKKEMRCGEEDLKTKVIYLKGV